MAREFLEEELKVRKSAPKSQHPGVAEEMEEAEVLIRSLLGLQIRWHPRAARHTASTGAMQGYAEIFTFPCCEAIVRDFLSTGEGDPPSQFRADGCEDIPESIRYDSRQRSNPFSSLLIAKYRELKTRDE